jgi:enterochelin esterase family protein
MPQVHADGATFRLADPQGRLASVRLWYHLRRPYPDLDFQRQGHEWTYRLARPDVDRLEYLLELTDLEGRQGLVVDAENPIRTGGPFGEHSVLEFPGYRPPDWLRPAAPGRRRDLTLPPAHGLRRGLPVTVWSPDGLDEDSPAPLLLAHDGPELDAFAALTQYCAAMVAAGRLPAHRVGLLAPLDRNAWYSASPAYARSLVTSAVPELLRRVPTSRRPVLLGASLGALAAFHAEWCHPGTFAGLYLASGSFFGMRFDAHEQQFARFWRIVAAVDHVLDAPEPPSRPVVTMVCGSAEENLDNNRVFAAALRRLGYPLRTATYRDGHTWVGWRDSLDPHLTSLLGSLWGAEH